MNAIDRLISVFDPVRALRRASSRAALAYYEAAKPSPFRKFRRDKGSPDKQVLQGAAAIRDQARHLQQNHDVARGILRTLVNNFVGAQGIGVQFQPRTRDGDLDEEYAKKLEQAYRDWVKRPEVTQRHSWAKVQRLMGSTWIRDGEAFGQHLLGPVIGLDHGTRVPYSLELIEPDLIPFDYDDQSAIRQGIGRNAWGRPITYYVYKSHPGDMKGLVKGSDLKQIAAERMVHVALLDRIGQLRGVSEFASVIGRLEDIKDYEESERIAAKIAARLTAYIRKGSPEMYDPADHTKNLQGGTQREIAFNPGTIIDGLAPGEEVGMIDSKRPNPNVVTFRQGQLRAAAAGVGASYSSIARDYSGTYSSQRQELVEQYVHYATLCDEFTSMFVAPVIRNFVMAAHLSGVVPIPRNVPIDAADDCLFMAQSMPWIDPVKEANAWVTLVRAGFASEVEVLQRRGVNPRDLIDQMAKFRRNTESEGLVLDSNAANDKPIDQETENLATELANEIATEVDPDAAGVDPETVAGIKKVLLKKRTRAQEQ
jgi:lambda family phage portal protein